MTPYQAAIIFIVAGEVANGPEPSGWISPLLQIPIGCVLAWFMLRAEKKWDEQNRRQQEQTNALNLMTQAMMVEVLATRNMDENIKQLAEKLKQQAQEANAHNDADSTGR